MRKRNIQKIQAENKRTYDRKTQEGTWVSEGRLSGHPENTIRIRFKLRPKFLGPYKVVAGGRRQCRVELFRSCCRVELFSPVELFRSCCRVELVSPVELSCFVPTEELSCFSPVLALIFELRGRVELFSPTAKLSCF
ncbi:hypothetical protein TNCV_935021 [Trichonephila clavipes]|nr:hypothetical protein TNCV_935021 [Trichonephila clavipes]